MRLYRYVICGKHKVEKLIFLLLFLFNTGNIVAQPGVVTQPTDTSICVGSAAEFSIVAVNTSAYQWQENDGVGWYNLTIDFTYAEGQFTPNLKINDANIGLNNYSYRCVVSDLNNDKDTSDAALLKVYEAPIITLDPVDETVCKNNIALFSIEAINGTNYKWQEYSGVGWVTLTDDSFYSGTTTPDLSIFTTTGMNGFRYRCIVKNVSCPDTSEYAELMVNPTPIIFNLQGGGEFCFGDYGVEIFLDNSEIGISYNLVKDGIETGNVIEGTGSEISFGNITESGIYSAFAYNQFTGCTVEMSSSVDVVENPLPALFEVLGGGNICEGDEGEDIFLENSETDVAYVLYRNGTPTGESLIGSGFILNFGKHNEEGVYTAIATNNHTYCSIQMDGSQQIIVNETPIAIAGPDKVINIGETTTLSGSGINGSDDYIYNWSPEFLVEDPNSESTQTHELNSSRTFILNITDAQTACISQPDTTVVFIDGGDLSVNINSSTTETCWGNEISLVAIPSGGDGNYQYEWTSFPEGYESELPNPNIVVESDKWYIVKVSSNNQITTDSIKINVFPKPQIFELQGGGEICDGSEGLNIELNSSQADVIYQLFRNDNDIVIEKIGTGSTLDFGEFDINGTYTAKAYTIDANCKSDMLGSATIIKNDKIFAYAGVDKVIEFSEYTTLNGSASGGSGNYLFNWEPATKLINPMVQSPTTVELFQSTLFELIVTDQISGCESEKANAIVFVGGDFPVSIEFITQSEEICPGEEKSILAMPSGGSGYYSYIWKSNPAGFSSSENEINVSPLVNTWYIVDVSDGLTHKTDSIEITPLPGPQTFSITGGGSYCPDEQGVNIYLDNSEIAVSYSLFHNSQPTGISLSGTGSQLNFGKILTEGNYSVIAENQYGCKSNMNSETQIIKNNKPIKYQLFGGGTYCDNDPTLGILLESSQTNVSYELYRNDESTGHNVEGNGLPLSFTTMGENGLFSVIAHSSEGCTEYMNGVIPLIINQSPQITVSGDTDICLGDTTLLTASGAISYVWNTIPPISNSQIELAPDINTTYSVTASNNTICKSIDSIEVIVNEKPEIYLENDILNFTVICSPPDYENYDFYLGEELIQSGQNNTLNYKNLAIIGDTLFVVVSNLSSCTDITSVYLENIDIPNAFTPDGDGKNDIFLKGFDIKIISRWGKEIYSGIDGWDGYYQGKRVTPGTYYYLLFLHDSNGNIANTKKGSVTVVIK